MGGLDTEVTEATRDVLIESAHFEPRAVRRTARTLGMHTDASHRFERGADPELCARAAERAAALLAEVAGGTVRAGRGRRARRAARRLAAAPGASSAPGSTRFAGVAIAAADVERWLAGLGFALRERPATAAGG